jgi:hypothetical protein
MLINDKQVVLLAGKLQRGIRTLMHHSPFILVAAAA